MSLLLFYVRLSSLLPFALSPLMTHRGTESCWWQTYCRLNLFLFLVSGRYFHFTEDAELHYLIKLSCISPEWSVNVLSMSGSSSFLLQIQRFAWISGGIFKHLIHLITQGLCTTEFWNKGHFPPLITITVLTNLSHGDTIQLLVDKMD